MNKRLIILIILLITCFQLYSQGSLPWRFVSHPDWHYGDYDLNDGPPPAYAEGQRRIMVDMASFKPDFILLGGDMIEGMWLDRNHIREKYRVDESLENFILTCAGICYDSINSRFDRHGLKPVAAIGDHEVGDQNWNLNSQKSEAIKYFKEAFSRAYTLDSEGNSLFSGYIGSVPQRPVGTQYEHTSNAIIHRNVMIVSIDIFAHESPSVLLHPVRGTVLPDVTGAHRQWLDDVLAAGSKIDSVEFIIVQIHFPVLLPIRKHRTSYMTVENGENSELWKTLKKYPVDLYFAGEVHCLTPSMDDESGIIQIVHGAYNNDFSPTQNYLVGEVEKGKLTLYSREKPNEDDFVFETTGKLVIDKTSAERRIISSGWLTPIDREGLLVHYAFEDTEPVKRIENSGIFGPRILYGNNTRLSPTEGVVGRGIEFHEGAAGYSRSFGQTPFHYDAARTFSCWIKTASSDKMSLITVGDATFTLLLNQGVPEIQANDNVLKATGKRSVINDNTWHHVVVTFPGMGYTLSDIAIYIDGERVPAATESGSAEIRTSPGGFVVIGASHNLREDYLTGTVDEVALWSSALTASMVKAMNDATKNQLLQYNAKEMDQLFHLFRKRGGSAGLNGATWKYATGLKGKPGVIRHRKGVWTIVLNNSGEGVTTGYSEY